MALERGSLKIWLAVCLAAQAGLLFWRLDLLPAWGDELFTLETIAQPPGRILDIVRGDIHPPLYYLLAHYWAMIPGPGDPLVRARALSGVWALATAAVFPRLWIGPEGQRQFLLLWALSPCLILYGRMARSYTMQMFLACLALHWGFELTRDPKRRGAAVGYAVFASLLLYTHYLPGIAVIGAVQAGLLWQAIRKGEGWFAAVAPAAVALALYAPWAASMLPALDMALAGRTHAVAGNPLVEQAVRLGFWGVSFTVGESAPLWAIVAGIALACAGLAGWKFPQWAPVVAIAGALAYFGAGRWVSYAFVPARVLFLLPFFLALLARRAWVSVGIACLSVVSLAGYFGRENFLNKGYLIPYERIARMIAEDGPARIIAHPAEFDASPVLRRVRDSEGGRVVWVIAAGSGAPVPQGFRESRREAFVPYSEFDKAALRWLGRPARTHVVDVVKYVRE